MNTYQHPGQVYAVATWTDGERYTRTATRATLEALADEWEAENPSEYHREILKAVYAGQETADIDSEAWDTPAGIRWAPIPGAYSRGREEHAAHFAAATAAEILGAEWDDDPALEVYEALEILPPDDGADWGEADDETAEGFAWAGVSCHEGAALVTYGGPSIYLIAEGTDPDRITVAAGYGEQESVLRITAPNTRTALTAIAEALESGQA